ncbi:unnamed protein product, partial [Staurois parvus]
MAEEENLDLIYDTNRERIQIPRNLKSKVERSKSSSVSHQMVEIEPTETVSEQSTVQSKAVGFALKDDTTNKTKDTLCKDKNSFTSHLIKIANRTSTIKRFDVTDFTDLPVVDEDEFVIHDITDFENGSKSCNKKTVKNPIDSKKNKKKEKNVPHEVLNVTYTSARKMDNSATDSRKSQKNGRDSSSPLIDKEKKSRSTEVDRLVLQKYLQADVDDQNESISSRPKRVSAPPSSWWVVKQAGRNCTFDVEEAFPQYSPKSKRKASADSREPSELQKDKEESFELKVSGPLGQYEEKALKDSDEKASKTLNTRKRRKKLKSVESKETAGPSKVKKRKKNDHKISQTFTIKKKKSAKLWNQLEEETQESDTASPQDNDL